MDLTSAERLTSVADPKGLSALKKQSGDPAAAKAVAGQFGALLMQGVMQGSDGAAMPMAGGGVGGNIVSALFANTISQAAMSGDKLGLADMLFRSIEAKQRAAGGSQDGERGATASQTPQPRAAPAPARASADGFPLSPYWQGSGLRPLGSGVTRAGKAGIVSNSDFGSTYAWAASPPIMANAGANGAGSSFEPRAAGAAPSEVAQAFAQQLRPLLQEAGRQLGVSPRILLAQAALETGWGRSVVGNNVFGIKASASWQGSEVTTMTHEVEAGQMVPRQAAFRSYPSLDAAVQDYVALIGTSRRYQAVVGVVDDAAAYAQGLVAGGYATDTEYARKLEAIAAGPSAAAGFAAPSQPGRLKLFAAEG